MTVSAAVCVMRPLWYLPFIVSSKLSATTTYFYKQREQASPLLGNLSPLSTSASWPWLPAAASWGLSFLCCCHTYSPQKPALGLHMPPQAALLLPPTYSQQGLTPTVNRHLPRRNTVDVTKVPQLRNLDQALALPLTNGCLVPVSGSRMFHPALNIHQPVRYHRMALGSPI